MALKQPLVKWQASAVSVLQMNKKTPLALVVFVALASRARFDGKYTFAWPSLNRVCLDTGLSRPTVSKMIALLEKQGFVYRFKNDTYRSKLTGFNLVTKSAL